MTRNRTSLINEEKGRRQDKRRKKNVQTKEKHDEDKDKGKEGDAK